MKKINFFIVFLITILSINSFIYMDIIIQLIPKTVGLYVDKVTRYDVLWNTILIMILNIIPFLILAYIYRKVYANKLWIIPIFMIYSFFWVYTSYLIVHGYIQHFGHTWLDIEVFNFMLEQEHFYMAYILSLVPMVFLIFYNKRSSL
jgi:hypothetical protein